MTKPKALIAWSSGKDSAWALHEVRRAGEYDVVGALTTVTETFRRVSMHGVREDILFAQHAAANLNQPHDLLFRALCDDPRRAGVLIRDYLPEWIASRLSDEPPVLLDGRPVSFASQAAANDAGIVCIFQEL